MAKEKPFLPVQIFFPAIMNKENFKGKAAAVSTENKMGKFDVLPQHINFITLIFKNLTLHTLKKEKIEYSFERGVLIVRKGEIIVFLGL